MRGSAFGSFHDTLRSDRKVGGGGTGQGTGRGESEQCPIVERKGKVKVDVVVGTYLSARITKSRVTGVSEPYK